VILLDTNVWIDAFAPGAPHHAWAAGLVRQGLLGEGIAINPVILAELCVGDCHPDTVWDRLDPLGVTLLDLPARTSWRCAEAYGDYLENRRQLDAPTAPQMPLPQFFIGAHASLLDLPLATADTKRYRAYYPEVRLITPSP
jgi:predicted nucleic acid-binding protein